MLSQEKKKPNFGITNLPKDKATPENVLELKRGHWSVENKVHYVLDELFAEDRCRCRTGTLAEVMSALRKIGISLLRRVSCGASLTSTTRALALQ
jgi:predicted transposase YbfD/YdcC